MFTTLINRLRKLIILSDLRFSNQHISICINQIAKLNPVGDRYMILLENTRVQFISSDVAIEYYSLDARLSFFEKTSTIEAEKSRINPEINTDIIITFHEYCTSRVQ